MAEIPEESAEDAGEFPVESGEQLADGEEIALAGGTWELPFPFGEPVNLGVEFEGGEPELEIEVELTGQRNDETPDLS